MKVKAWTNLDNVARQCPLTQQQIYNRMPTKEKDSRCCNDLKPRPESK